MLFEYHEFMIYANICLSVCSIGRFLNWVNYTVLKFHFNVDHSATYNIVLWMVLAGPNKFANNILFNVLTFLFFPQNALLTFIKIFCSLAFLRLWLCVQTIQKVLVAYAELVQRDFNQFTSKHDVVSCAFFTNSDTLGDYVNYLGWLYNWRHVVNVIWYSLTSTVSGCARHGLGGIVPQKISLSSRRETYWWRITRWVVRNF